MKRQFIVISISIFLFLMLIFLLNKYNKYFMVRDIISEWKYKTDGGFVKIDKCALYKGDYYLSLSKTHDDKSHIHLIVDKYGIFICYVIKKYDFHSNVYYIEPFKNATEIVEEMITNIENFKY